VPPAWRALRARAPAEAPSTAAGPRVHAVAILPFASEEEASQLGWSAAGLAELLAGALQESPAVRVVPPARVAQVLDDIGFASGNLDNHALVQLGGVLQVDRLVTGRVDPQGDRLQLAVSLHEVAADRTVPHQLPVLSGGAGELFVLTDRLGEELRKRLELAPVARPTTSTSPQAMRGYTEGLALLTRGDPKAAAVALTRAVTIDPGFGAAWLELSRANQRLGLDDQATRAAQRATAAAPADSRLASEARAQEALLRDRPEEAQRALAELVERYPNDLAARVALAEAYGGQGAYDRAMAVIEPVAERDPNDPRVWFLLGRFAFRAGDAHRAANTYLTRALLLQQERGDRAGQAEVLNALGVAYEHLGKMAEAVSQYRRAAELRQELGDQGGFAIATFNLGQVLTVRGEFADAEQALREALAIQEERRDRPRVAAVESGFGDLEEARGNYDAALERYKRALQLRGQLGDEANLAESHNNVGYVYFLLGDYENARVYLGRAFDLYEKHGNARGALLVLQSRGACELAQGEWREALATFQESLDRSRQLDLKAATAVAHGSLARLAYLEGRYGAALTGFGNARHIVDRLEDRRGQAEFALGEAETLIELGALEEAGRRLAEVETWRREGLSKEHEAQLFIVQGRLAVDRGDRAAARRSFSAGAETATASHSPPLALEARLEAASTTARPSATELRAALDQARALGHAALELAAAEELARAELAAGRSRQAEDELRTALQRVRDSGSWRRAFALRRLLAVAFEKRGAKSEAKEQRDEARAELMRIVQDVPERWRAGFQARAEAGGGRRSGA
jgi:eukaryotic-like serine/threonine-protein kinase